MRTRPVAATIFLVLALAWACEDDTENPYEDGDVTPPGSVSDLTVDSVTSSTITLTWTAPGDDGSIGRATSYTLKRSGAVIDASNFAAATTVSGVPAPATVGTAESFTVPGLDSTLTYYFAIRAVDEAGNQGAVSNNANWTIHFSKAIPSYKDNTLYEELGLCMTCPGTNGVLDSLSNGTGEYVFAGQNNIGDARRALMAFAIADSLPSEATIDSVVLTLNLSRAIGGSVSNALHRVTADWGEGTSDASCCAPEEGAGGSAMAGDATWLQRVFRTTDWTTPGGDYAAAPSAARSVGGVGAYSWQSTQMTADVQGWLDSPATNFGWIMIGDESASTTAKRYDAHESAATRPTLTVYYTVPSP